MCDVGCSVALSRTAVLLPVLSTLLTSIPYRRVEEEEEEAQEYEYQAKRQAGLEVLTLLAEFDEIVMGLRTVG